MIKTLFILIPLAAAVAMPLWIARRRGHADRWVLPWLVTLLPLGTVLLLHSLDVMSGLGNTVTLPLIAVAVLGLAAFTGGALYLVVPVLLGAANEAVLRGRMVETAAPTRRRDEGEEEGDSAFDLTNAMNQASSSVGFSGFETDDYNWDKNKYY